MSHTLGRRDPATTEANARLIAAAPDLLRLGEEAATLLEDWVEIITENNPSLNTGTLKGTASRLRAIIAKATGQEVSA